jgi:ubiquinone biosynthesis protein COQ4
VCVCVCLMGAGEVALRALRAKMAAHPDGQHILATRPRVTEASINLPRLRTLHPSTFGAQYAQYMDSHK